MWIGLLSLLAACAVQTPIAYKTSGAAALPAAATPVIGKVTAVDQRNEADPTWIGAVRGGYGNPLKVLHAPEPVADIVTSSFRAALADRGLLAAAGPARYDLHVAVARFESDQVVRREAKVELNVEVIERSGGRQVYHDAASVDLVSGNDAVVDVGVFGSTDGLRLLVQEAMSKAIDQILAKPALLAALKNAG
jgi:hypothetical protein